MVTVSLFDEYDRDEDSLVDLTQLTRSDDAPAATQGSHP